MFLLSFMRQGWVIVGLLASPAAVAAPIPGTINGVVEFFTSQGCSSCPPADRLASALAARADIVVLTFPINYWDYIGWKDTLAAPEFTARQQAYANGRTDPHIYTPEAVVDGLFDTVGSDKTAIEKAITRGMVSGEALNIVAHLREFNGKLEIDISGGKAAPAGIYILRVIKTRTVQISRGENSGRKVTYTNIVRAIRKVGDWDGAPLSLKLTELRGDDEGYVLLLQRGSLERPGAILAAAKSAGL
jgi:hypothetical protein